MADGTRGCRWRPHRLPGCVFVRGRWRPHTRSTQLWRGAFVTTRDVGARAAGLVLLASTAWWLPACAGGTGPPPASGRPAVTAPAPVPASTPSRPLTPERVTSL